MMTEDEYVNVRNLTKIRCAAQILYDVIVGDGRHIPTDEHSEVLRLISGWERELEKVVTTDE